MAILLAALLIGLTGCKHDSDPPPGPVQKKLTITGLTGFNGEVIVQLYPIAMGTDAPIGTGAEIPPGSTSFTFDLYEDDGLDWIPWTGSADLYVFIAFLDLGAAFVYTNGSTLAELGISDFIDDIVGNMEKLPKLAFNQDVTTVNLLDKFKSVMVGP